MEKRRAGMTNQKRNVLGMLAAFCILCFFWGCGKEPAGEKREGHPDEKWEEQQKEQEQKALPVVEITCQTRYDSLELNSYQDCKISFQGVSYEGKETMAGELDASLKYRGNSTRYRPKRSFHLKLSKKRDLYGMGENKHWVLLANDIDHTQMRNILLNQFAYDLGSEVKLDSVSVDLYYNGEYEGVYQLCEHVRIGENTIDIMDWQDLAKKAAKVVAKAQKLGDEAKEQLEEMLQQDYAWLDEPHEVTFEGKTYDLDKLVEIPERTGGFLLEMDFYAFDDPLLAKLVSAYRLPLYFNKPEAQLNKNFMETSLFQYAKRYMQSFEYALHADDFFYRDEDEHYATAKSGRFSWSDMKWMYSQYVEKEYADPENDGKHYSEFFDLDSLVNNFIFCEYAMNWDSMKNSFFVYKDVNELGKIGPQWDMDWCWGNRNMYGIDTNFPENWHTTMEYFANEQYYQTQQYNRLLIHDPFFLARVYEKYHQIRPTLIEEMIREGGSIDAYAAYLKESAKKNDERWKATYQEYRGLTFTLAVNQMKNFVVKRVKWLDEQFADFDSFVDSLGGYPRSRFVLMGEPLWEADGSVVVRANVSNGAKAVRFWLNGVLSQDSAVQEGVAEARFDASHLDPEHINIVVAMELDDAGNYIYDGQASIEGDYHIVMGNYVLLEK